MIRVEIRKNSKKVENSTEVKTYHNKYHGALGLPVVVDGFISGVAALAAVHLCPMAGEYMIASHVSKEPAGALILSEIGKSPSLVCDMCLGEGTGAVALFPLLDMGLHIYEKMSTFSQIEVE